MDGADAKRAGAPLASRPFPLIRLTRRALAADLRHVLGGGALLALHDFELNALAFGKRLEALALDRRVMHEAILLAVLGRDESKALRVVESFHGTGRTHSCS